MRNRCAVQSEDARGHRAVAPAEGLSVSASLRRPDRRVRSVRTNCRVNALVIDQKHRAEGSVSSALIRIQVSEGSTRSPSLTN